MLAVVISLFKKTEIFGSLLNFSKKLTKQHLSKNIRRLVYFSGICSKNKQRGVCQIIKTFFFMYLFGVRCLLVTNKIILF